MGKLNTVNNGKGDKPRPVEKLKQYLDEYDRIFGKKKDKKELAKGTKKVDTSNNESTTNSI
jgi:hypothetical protein